jgi:hypothetical protein
LIDKEGSKVLGSAFWVRYSSIRRHSQPTPEPRTLNLRENNSNPRRKMKLKKEYILLSIVIIMLSVYLIMRTSDRTQYELPEVPTVAAGEISKLQITRDKVDVSITKQDEKWYIGPDRWPADENKIKDMLKAIESLTLTALVSESRNYSLYDLDSEKKINVKAWSGESLKRDVDLGKTASSFRHTFVKTAGDDRVYHARGNLREDFEVTKDHLRDKIVLSIDTAEIQQIKVTRDQQTLTLSKTQIPVKIEGDQSEKKAETSPKPAQPVWQAADGRQVEEAVIKQILDGVASLRCEKFINDRQKSDFSSPSLRLQLKGAQEYSLSIFPKANEKDTDYPAVSSGSDYPFLLSQAQVDRLMKNPIKEEKPPATEPTETEKK